MKNILINLPAAFFTQAELQPAFARLEALGQVRRTSHDKADQIAPDVAWADVIFMWAWPFLDEALLAASKPIDFIGHIDMSQKMARAELGQGIPVSLSKGGWSPAVAELALALVLNGLRRVSDYHAAMRAGTERWVRALPADVDPRERELTGAKVAVVGFGQVGRRLGELLGPFRTDLHVVDPFVPEETIAAHGGRRVDLDEAIAACDVVVLCAAANSGTDHLLDAKRVAALRPDAVLVNVARARLIDMAALVTRLRQGDLVAALDVFEKEPLDPEAEIRQVPNAHLTPHRAGGLIASVQRTIHFLIDDYERWLAGEPRRYAVTEQLAPLLDG